MKGTKQSRTTVPLWKLRSPVSFRNEGPSQLHVEREIECGLIVTWRSIKESGKRQAGKIIWRLSCMKEFNTRIKYLVLVC